jgi:hypothetical protein
MARKAKATEVAAPQTWRERMKAVDERAAATRAAVEAEYAERGYGPVTRASTRWMGRTKGLPFSRMKLVQVLHNPGKPSMLVLRSYTRKTGHIKQATPALLQQFFPSLPPQLSAQMLGLAI